MVRRSGQARPGESGWRPSGRARAAGVWAVVAAAVVILAFVVGRPPDGQAGRTTTPGPSGPSDPAGPSLVFGTVLDPQTNVATGAVDAFGVADTVAYSLTLPEPLSVAEVLIAVDRVGGGDRVQVQEPTSQQVDPARTTFGVAVPAERLLAAWGPGTYRISVSLADGATLATGRFTLEAS